MYHVTIEEMDQMRIKAENEAIKHAIKVDSLREKVEELERARDIEADEHFKLRKENNKVWSEYIEVIEFIKERSLMHLLPERIQKDWAPKQPG